MSFDSRHLGAFLAIVNAGSLGRAAEVLHVTQPALSRTLRRLEAQVGAPLFERHSKGMLLTPVGRALLPHATLLQRGLENAAESLNVMRGLATGTIKVGAIGSVASRVLPIAIGRVLQRWPSLKVQVIEGVWDRLAEALMQHEIDIALDVVERENEAIGAIPDCRWQDRSHVVAACDHPLRRKRRLRLSDTMALPFAVPPRGTAPYEHMRQTYARHGLDVPNVVVETRSITVLKSLITRAGFLSWMAEPIYDAERAGGLIDKLAIPDAEGVRTLTAFRRREGILPAPAQKLVDELRQIAPGD